MMNTDKTIVVTDIDGTYTVNTDKIEWTDTDAGTMGYDKEIYILDDENEDTIFYVVWDA